MSINFHKHPVTCIMIAVITALAVAAMPLVTASCGTQHTEQDEAAALARLRAMTRGGLLPTEHILLGIESEYPNRKAGALARMARARVKMAARDFAAASSLLNTGLISQQTVLGDYALFMRAQALEQAGQRAQARAAYEQLAHDFPSSLRAREAILRAAGLAQQDGQAAAIPALVKKLSDADDAAALLLAAKAYEQQGDALHALAAYRRIYFYAPASLESAEVPAALTRLNSTTSPATAEEAIKRADKLYEAKHYTEAVESYTDAFARFLSTVSPQTQLRRGISAFHAQRNPETITSLNAVPTSAGDLRAEALYYLAQTYARTRQWNVARSITDEVRRVFPDSPWSMRALMAAGQEAKNAKSGADVYYFFRAAMTAYPGAAEVAPAQFEIAWLAHDAKNYQESSRLLIEHLANYADKNTDYRGRAGYWAGRDAERAGRLAEARVIYDGMQARYHANWYGYLAKQRLDALNRLTGSGSSTSQNKFAADSLVSRAVTNLSTVTVAEETAGPSADEQLNKADQLTNIGLTDWALDELNKALESALTSPRLNLAKARIYRARNDNLQAFNTLKISYPDYAQMIPEELRREEWDVFYPLSDWDIITQEARAKSLDPYMVAGLIRQETVFNSRAVSSARAYGLMQLLVGTGTRMARKNGITRDITVESLFEPRLNIQLGTSYLRDQLDRFGRIEYAAAAYNAGPERAAQWRATLPLEIDEWAEAIPFKETRGYVQGVVRNTLQYKRLYDENGQFRIEVGANYIHAASANKGGTMMQPAANGGRPRRATSHEED